MEELIIEKKFRDADGNKFYNEYKVLKKYGEGSVGKVKKVLNTKLDKSFAMKIVHKMLLKMRKEYYRLPNGKMGIKTAFDAVEKEISLLKNLDHENIVKLHEILTDEENEKLYLILDDWEQGEIMKWDADSLTFTPWHQEPFFSEDEIKGILRDTIKALKYLHGEGIMHRDIKPGNLLMTHEGKVKIADFGVATKIENQDDDRLKSTEGTYHFMSPECWNFETKDFSGTKADIWALGVTLYAMTYNKMPFWADNELELGNVIMKEEQSFEHDRDASQELKELINLLLIKDPDSRPTLDDILQTAFMKDEE